MSVLLYALINLFYRFYPVNQGFMHSRTEFKIDVRADTIFFHARCHSPYGIYTETLDRDHLKIGEDFVGLIITQDRNTGYFFMINAIGTEQDGIIIQRRRKKRNWDFVWSARTRIINDTLWTVELKIPIEQMNFKADSDSLILHLNIVRSARLEKVGEAEAGTLFPIKGTNFYDLEFAKKFVFHALKNAGSWEVYYRPYTAFYYDSGSYFDTGSDLEIKTEGGDIGITINPEYFTVEEDVERFNLDKAYMVYYPEKRPFFMSGFELWNLPFKVLYTRTLIDIDAGLKGKLRINDVKFNFFTVSEKDSISRNLNPHRLTGGIRTIYSLKFADLGAFYIRSRDTFEARGTDILIFLPCKFRLNAQYTLDRNGSSDIYFHFYRYVKPGFSIESGFDRVDSIEINTAYFPFPKFIRMAWLYLTFDFIRNTEYLPYYEIGIGGAYEEYLNGKLFESKGSIYLAMGIRNNLDFLYNYIPWKRYEINEDKTYYNSLHYITLEYQPFSRHKISAEVQTGEFFGGTQLYYAVAYRYRQRFFNLSLGYGYDREPFYSQKRFYLKFRYNLKSKVKIRFFFQNSSITGQEAIFLTGYRIYPGSSIYFAVSHSRTPNGANSTAFMLKYVGFFQIR